MLTHATHAEVEEEFAQVRVKTHVVPRHVTDLAPALIVD